MSPRLQTAAGIVVYVSTLAALVVLQLKGQPVDDLMVLAGPVVAALLVAARVDSRADEARATLARITDQTNGVLDARIAEGVRATLQAHAPDIYRARHE